MQSSTEENSWQEELILEKILFTMKFLMSKIF